MTSTDNKLKPTTIKKKKGRVPDGCLPPLRLAKAWTEVLFMGVPLILDKRLISSSEMSFKQYIFTQYNSGTYIEIRKQNAIMFCISIWTHCFVGFYQWLSDSMPCLTLILTALVKILLDTHKGTILTSIYSKFSFIWWDHLLISISLLPTNTT